MLVDVSDVLHEDMPLVRKLKVRLHLCFLVMTL